VIAEAFEFPDLNAILRWKEFSFLETFNKIGLIAVLAAVIGIAIFLIAGSKPANKAPRGVRNLAESTVEFIENGVVMQTMGKDGLGWTPFLLGLFLFIYFCNLPGIIPFFQMPATARIVVPAFLAVIVWLVYNGAGLKHQGIHYLLHTIWPPSVPVALRPLVGLIEFVSNIIVRPFSLTIRLFANMLAGHILLVTFALLTQPLVTAETQQLLLKPMAILPFAMLVGLTAFEVLVGFLQAYIFTMLTAVYIGASTHPEH